MLKIRPSLLKILYLFLLLIISVLAMGYSVMHIDGSSPVSYYSIIVLLVLVLGVLAFFYSFAHILYLLDFWRIDFDSDTVICKSLLRKRTIKAEDIDSIALVTPSFNGINYSLTFYGKKYNPNPFEEAHSDIFWFKKSDVKNLINQLNKLNPNIKLSQRLKNYMAGRALWLRIISPNLNQFEDSPFHPDSTKKH